MNTPSSPCAPGRRARRPPSWSRPARTCGSSAGNARPTATTPRSAGTSRGCAQQRRGGQAASRPDLPERCQALGPCRRAGAPPTPAFSQDSLPHPCSPLPSHTPASAASGPLINPVRDRRPLPPAGDAALCGDASQHLSPHRGDGRVTRVTGVTRVTRVTRVMRAAPGSGGPPPPAVHCSAPSRRQRQQQPAPSQPRPLLPCPILARLRPGGARQFRLYQPRRHAPRGLGPAPHGRGAAIPRGGP
jgi:hypothetical protein